MATTLLAIDADNTLYGSANRSLKDDSDRNRNSLPKIRQSTWDEVSISTVDNTKYDVGDNGLDHDCQYLPDELLVALNQPSGSSASRNLAGHSHQRHKAQGTPNNPSRKPAANVWNYQIQREKRKNLMRSSPCVCGAGKDISFLYDIPTRKTPEFPKIAESNEIGQARAASKFKATEVVKSIADSLVPEEYCIVKNKGVVQFDFVQDSFTVQPKDHEKHQTVFPSMNPTSRYEVIQLKQTLNDMLEKAGVKVGVDEDEVIDRCHEPSQLHQILEIIKTEQDIFNIVFHEIIRQVSVECVERGELLAEVRLLYNNLIGKIPRQICSLHDEVLAQRALDRRLTEELGRFKSRVSKLTDELEVVKDHDSEVTKQSVLTQQELKLALAESIKNSNLLVEYRSLYELQRTRLENQVEALTEESRMWCGSCYSLASKVIDEHCLNSVRQLCITEKSWASLAVHFTVMLSERDTKELGLLRMHVNTWKELSDSFYATFRTREDGIRRRLETVIEEINKFHRSLSDATVNESRKSPGKDKISICIRNMKEWELNLSEVMDVYGGESVLNCQDSLKALNVQVAKWTNCAITVFNRHRMEEADEVSTHPCRILMLTTNQQVESLMNQFRTKITGDDGVVDGVSIVWNGLEDWQIRLNAALRDSDEFVPLPLWKQLSEQLHCWVNMLQESLSNINNSFCISPGADDNLDDNVSTLGLFDVTKNVQKWLSSTTLSMESEDAKLTDQVYIMQKDLIHWTTQALQRLVPDRFNLTAEAREAELFHTAYVEELVAKSEKISVNLIAFTSHVRKCCAEFVAHETQRKRDVHDENAEHEHRELRRFETECNKWIEINKNVQIELREATTVDDTRIKSARSDHSKKNELIEINVNEVNDIPEYDELENEIEDHPELLFSKENTGISESLLSASESAEDLIEMSKQRASAHTKGERKSTKHTHKKKAHSKPEKKVVHHLDLKKRATKDEVELEEIVIPKDDAIKSELKEIETPTSIMREVINTENVTPMLEQDIDLVNRDDEEETMEILGYDSSTRKVSLHSSGPSIGNDVGDSQSVMAVEFLQQQLIKSERRAHLAQERISVLETQLAEALERIRLLERSPAVTPASNGEAVFLRTTATPASAGKTKNRLNVPETGRRPSLTTAPVKDKDRHRFGSSRSRGHEDKHK